MDLLQDFKQNATIRQRILLYCLERDLLKEESLEKKISSIKEDYDIYYEEYLHRDLIKNQKKLGDLQERLRDNFLKSYRLGMGNVNFIAFNFEEYTGIKLEKDYFHSSVKTKL